MDMYRVRALEGATAVEFTIALYDGIIRFMHNAIEAVERKDVGGRRAAVKRAMDIVIHLQATLKTDVGGKPAESLADFYVAIFALMLQGSQASSKKKFEQVIANVRNVRDAWKQVLADSSNRGLMQEGSTDQGDSNSETSAPWLPHAETHGAGNWTA